jgi:hypothetical protein
MYVSASDMRTFILMITYYVRIAYVEVIGEKLLWCSDDDLLATDVRTSGVQLM